MQEAPAAQIQETQADSMPPGVAGYRKERRRLGGSGVGWCQLKEGLFESQNAEK